MQAGFFVAPVIYPLGILPERYHCFLYLWAPTPFIQFSRGVLVDGAAPEPPRARGARGWDGRSSSAPACCSSGATRPRAAEYL